MWRTRKSKETITPKMNKFIEKNLAQYFMKACHVARPNKRKMDGMPKGKMNRSLLIFFKHGLCVCVCSFVRSFVTNESRISNIKWHTRQKKKNEPKRQKKRRRQRQQAEMKWKNPTKKTNSFNLLVSLLFSVLYWIVHLVHALLWIVATLSLSTSLFRSSLPLSQI